MSPTSESAERRARARRRRRGRMCALPGAAPRPTPRPSGRGATVPLLRASARRRPRRSGGRPDRGHRVLRPGAARRGVGRRRRDRRALRPRLARGGRPPPPSAETVVAIVGALLAGAPVVPVPPDSGPAERAHVLTDSGATTWFGDKPRDVTLPGRRVDLSRRAGHEVREADGDGPALILYTSGTTGSPKGVLLSAEAMAAGLDGLAEAWDWTAADTLAHGLPDVPRARAGARGVRGAADRVTAGAHRPADPRELRPRRAPSTAARCCSGCRRCGRGSRTTRRRRPP